MDKKETIKKIIIQEKEQGIPPDLIEREIRNQIELRPKKACTISGTRKSGKTYLMYQLMKKAGQKNTFYINLEDERIINPQIEDLTNLVPIIKETYETPSPFYLFIDEIQNIEGWEKWARRIAEKNTI